MLIRVLYPNFKHKCVTFSYDDGVIQDKKFLSLIKNSKFKVTFNLNSGLFSCLKFRDGVDNSRLDNHNLKALYYGHEIASHSLYHFHMEDLSYEENYDQINQDIKNLKEIFKQDVKGFAYPFGKYNDDTILALKNNHIVYARTTLNTYNFDLPKDFLKWNPTIHHNDNKIFEVVDTFINTNQELALLYIWGHTYEFANQNNFDIVTTLVDKLNNKEDIAFLTNIQINDYINALRNVEVKNNTLINHSNLDIYLEIDNQFKILHASSIMKIEGEFIWKKY